MAQPTRLAHAELAARLSLSQAAHQTTKNELTAIKTELATTTSELTTTQASLAATQDQLAALTSKLALAEQEAQNLREWYDELQRAQITQNGGSGFGLKAQEGISMPKYKGRCPREMPGVECKEKGCPWLHQVQARGFSKRVVGALPHDPVEERRRMERGEE
ncbi:hypothetical protein HBI52_082550 [Parastagonospora nodorum]|nr:hypothetical protein HBI79_036920 [Parastagonospora nodorum]KAH5519735.1 hypothetical protein HBI52_082550 [Parastagonospora nodorum]KAH6395032.1 hypothetical protein HBI60_132500 [Parastagonospora nodorum]